MKTAATPEGESLFTDGPNAAAAECAIRHYASCVGLPAQLGIDVFPLVLARHIHLNVVRGRVANARRAFRVLSAYIAAPSRFVRALQSEDRRTVEA